MNSHRQDISQSITKRLSLDRR